jgi:hypothetical protein
VLRIIHKKARPFVLFLGVFPKGKRIAVGAPYNGRVDVNVNSKPQQTIRSQAA